jgi:hypothetical protein
MLYFLWVASIPRQTDRFPSVVARWLQADSNFHPSLKLQQIGD